MLRPVKVLGITNRTVVWSYQQDTSSYKLLLTLILGDVSPIEDSGDNLGGVLVRRALALVSIFALAVLGLIIVAPLAFC